MRRLVVDPDFHGGDAAEGDVAFHVHLHARRVLEGIGGGACLHRRVFRHVVERLLAVHHIDGLGSGHRNTFEGSACLFHPDGTEIDDASLRHGDGTGQHIVTHERGLQQVAADRYIGNGETTVGLGECRANYPHIGIRGNNAHTDVEQLVLVKTVHQHAFDGGLGQQFAGNQCEN